MADKTVKQLVDEVHSVAIERGMDVSPSDVGYIISLFFEGMVHDKFQSGAEQWLQAIADEAGSVKDE